MAHINYEQKGKIVTITLNRPERLNALNGEMLAELKDAWEKYAADPEARVAILTGVGRAFSVGLDVYELPSRSAEMEDNIKRLRPADDETISIMSQVEKPIIAAINGLAVAAGCILVLRSDIRIAAESSTLGMPEINIGLYGGVDTLIVQGIPLSIVMELVLTGKPLSAQRAYEVGLINRVVPAEEVMPTAIKVAEIIAGLPPLAVKLNKRVAIETIRPSPEVLTLRKAVFRDLLESEDYQEAKQAFEEKRKARFAHKDPKDLEGTH